MEVYEMLFNEQGENVFKVSLVDVPAVGAISVKMNENEPVSVSYADEEKRIMYAVVMSPDKKIYRSNIFQNENDPIEGYVFASAETIEKYQQNYMRNAGMLKTNLQHSEKDTDGVYPVESWIVIDKEHDKATKMGMEVQNGDWIQGWKFDNLEAWKDAKENKINGASIEGLIMHKKVTQKIINMNKNSILKDVQEHFMKLAAELKTVKVGDSTYIAIDFELGEIVVDENGAPITDSSFLFDNNTYTTDAIGAIIDITPVNGVEDVVIDTALAVEDTSELDALKEENAKLKEEIAILEAEKVKAKESLATMAEQKPAVASIQNVPIALSKTEMTAQYEAMTPLERFRYDKTN